MACSLSGSGKSSSGIAIGPRPIIPFIVRRSQELFFRNANRSTSTWLQMTN